MRSLWFDLRYALRQLRKSPGFALTVILTLALGIGMNAAVFSLFDRVLLRLLPVEQPRELVRFEFFGAFSGSASSFGGEMKNFFSYPMYKDLRDKNQVFSGMIAADRAYVGVGWRNQAENKEAELVTGNYFQVLGLQPALGRLFTPSDDTAKNSNPVLVLSYDYWRTRFAGDPSVVGQTVLINGHSFTVLGVAPQGFDSAIGGYRPGMFLPVSMCEVALPWMAERDNLNSHQSIWLTMVGRLKPGVTRQQAEASLQPLWHSLRAEELNLYKAPSERFRHRFLDNTALHVLDDSGGYVPERLELKTPLFILMAMAGLLVAMCALNVATMLLLRASSRAREMAMRFALGAHRGRIVVQLLVEGGLLGLSGALAGVALAPMAASLLVRLLTASDPGQEPFSAAIDGRVLVFTFAVSLLLSIFFGIAPAFHFLRPNLAQELRQNAGTAARSSQRFRKLAVGTQIALSVLLLGTTGLFVHTLNNLRHQAVGFTVSSLTSFALDPTNSGYREAQTLTTIQATLDVLARIPGVAHVAATTDPELVGNTNNSGMTIQGYKETEGESMDFEAPWITPNYFATLGQPVLGGREFTAADAQGQPKVAIVNQAFALRYFGSPQAALGRMLADARGSGVKLDTTIVGVVGDVRHKNLRSDPVPTVYRPYLQLRHPLGVQMYVRSQMPPTVVQSSIRQAIHQLDSTLVVDGMRTMEEQIDHSATGARALAYLAIGFSLLAVLLSAVGIYGVLAYATNQRTREFGVRLALGAPRSHVVHLVLREMTLIASIAIAVALPAVVALARFFRSELYGVAIFDVSALAAALFFTLLISASAALLPARRAASIQPNQALRAE